MTVSDIAITIVFCGFGLITGQAMAETWRPAWQIVMYGVLLAIGARLSMLVLFSRHLGGVAGEAVELVALAAIIVGFSALAYRLTRARTMVRQYPWLYERNGLFGWREKRQEAQGIAEKTG
jgi:branched-chain amino acid transport system ATP-binding protein